MIAAILLKAFTSVLQVDALLFSGLPAVQEACCCWGSVGLRRASGSAVLRYTCGSRSFAVAPGFIGFAGIRNYTGHSGSAGPEATVV